LRAAPVPLAVSSALSRSMSSVGVSMAELRMSTRCLKPPTHDGFANPSARVLSTVESLTRCAPLHIEGFEVTRVRSLMRNMHLIVLMPKRSIRPHIFSRSTAMAPKIVDEPNKNTIMPPANFCGSELPRSNKNPVINKRKPRIKKYADIAITMIEFNLDIVFHYLLR